MDCKTHCIEHADIDDQESSSDTLHVFNDYKPSYADIRFSICDFDDECWDDEHFSEAQLTRPSSWPMSLRTVAAGTHTR